jgi:hypothetical protein
VTTTLSVVTTAAHSLHAHDWLMLAGVAGVALFVYRFFVGRTANRGSKINIDDLFLDDTTRRTSVSKTLCLVGSAFLGVVLLALSISGKPVAEGLVTIYGIFAATVVSPSIVRIFKGGEAVSPAQYANPVPQPLPAPAPVVVAGTNIQTGAPS